jgi:hypothetical protein
MFGENTGGGESSGFISYLFFTVLQTADHH